MHAPAGFAKHAVSNPNFQTMKTALPRRKLLAPADPRFYGCKCAIRAAEAVFASAEGS
jgi:hypothetical protein